MWNDRPKVSTKKCLSRISGGKEDNDDDNEDVDGGDDIKQTVYPGNGAAEHEPYDWHLWHTLVAAG